MLSPQEMLSQIPLQASHTEHRTQLTFAHGETSKWNHEIKFGAGGRLFYLLKITYFCSSKLLNF